MPVNSYFQSGLTIGRSSEQLLMEDLMIECLKIYGWDTLYIPRQTVRADDILNEDTLNNFPFAYPIEMYLTSVEGFQGEGSLLSKFGLEIRDTANFVVSRRRWDEVVAKEGRVQLTTRPAEGDLIYFPMTQAFFEIRRTVSKNPFFQVGKLYCYQLECELYQFSSEQFTTGYEEVDNLATEASLDELLTGNVTVMSQDPQSQNEVFVSNSDVLNFDANNPFGEPRH
jgi:hypothetical protein